MPPKETPALPKRPAAEYVLYIMRQGAAVTAGDPSIPDDSNRPLTAQDGKRLRKIVAGLLRLGFAVDWIVSSPLARALETAKIVAEALGPGVPLELSEDLSPGGSAEALLSFLAEHTNRTRTLVVGHEPGLCELAARLIGAGRQANLTLKKGGCCMITFHEFPPRSPGLLVWLLTPRQLRRLA